MIVNLFDKEKAPAIRSLVRLFLNCYGDIMNYFNFRNLYKEGNHLKKFFKNEYPNFKVDLNGNTKCVSCLLCQDICPTKSIEINKPNMVNFPDSLTSGEAPLHFYLNVESCTKCNQCVDVCAVDALELKGKYLTFKIDLVS